ncbi:MAG: sigma-70 family RNA polymerase sigma factor [Gemmatimonas sp.]|jgi:RNA polymerase sigma-70 factor (ECF subfamily)|uniref:sigma-70 family RNA polymerase sigma factor n=1 Tax=Gemmatimonas sp. TaxID=1962908 RepID=UPI00391F576A|nr:sigma-70 family RNA polymerase sigma factor [Gemmatimonadota bacterium]
MATPTRHSIEDRQREYEALVLPHLDRLLGFAARRTATLVDAEDAVQDTCVRAWAAFDQLRDPRRVRAWLYRILRTVLSESVERQTRRAQLLPLSRLDNVHEALVTTATDGVFDALVSRLDREVLEAALQVIPHDFATAVELHDIEGFTYAEIADTVGVPIGTVMSRMSRGRRLLAAVIAERAREWALGAPAEGQPRRIPRPS